MIMEEVNANISNQYCKNFCVPHIHKCLLSILTRIYL